jgi:hypothetical protein
MGLPAASWARRVGKARQFVGDFGDVMHRPHVGSLMRGNPAGIPGSRPRLGSLMGGHALPRRPLPMRPVNAVPIPGALPRRTPGGYRTMGGIPGHRGNAYPGKYQIPTPKGPRGRNASMFRHQPPRPVGAAVAAARRPRPVAPPAKSRRSLGQHARGASQWVLQHKGKAALGGAAAMGAAAFMTRRGPGTGQSTGGVPTGMYGY